MQLEELVVYTRPEDEFYHKYCSVSFTFPSGKRPSQEDELEALRLVMLLTAEQATKARYRRFNLHHHTEPWLSPC